MLAFKDLGSSSLALAGNAAVEALQAALTAYARISGKVSANPGGIDGIVGPRTLAAIQAVIGPLTSQLGSFGFMLQQAIALANTSTQARQTAITFISSNAPALARGVQSLSLAAVGTARTAEGVMSYAYPSGTIKTRSGERWRIGVPRGTSVQATLSGAGALGQTHEEVAPRPVADTVTASEVDKSTFEKSVAKPWYKKWYYIAGIAVGTAAVGTGIYVVVKR